MTNDEMKALTDGADTKAQKIRLLFESGVKRAEICDFVGVSYGHVQTVLRRSKMIGKDAVSEGANGDVTIYTLAVGPGGTVTLPEEYTRAHGISPGDALVARSDESGLTIMSREAALGAIAEIARKRMSPSEAKLLEALLGKPGGSPTD